MVNPRLTLPPLWEAEESYDVGEGMEAMLGDGYIASSSTIDPRVTWSIKGIEDRATTESIVTQLREWGGVTSFLWSPNVDLIPEQLFFVSEWNTTPLGPDTYEITMTLTQDIESPCAEHADLIDEAEILTTIGQAKTFLDNFSGPSSLDSGDVTIVSGVPREGSTWLHFYRRYRTESGYDFFRITVTDPDGLSTDIFNFSGFGTSWTNSSYLFEKKGIYTIRFAHIKDEYISASSEFVGIDNLTIGNSSNRGSFSETYLTENFNDAAIPTGWTNSGWAVTTSSTQEGSHSLASTLTEQGTAYIEFSFEIYEAINNNFPSIISSDNLVVKQYHQEGGLQIPWQAGTLYDQINMGLAALRAYTITENEAWLTLATDLANALITYYYNSSDAQTRYLPHWLINIEETNGSIAVNQLFEIYPSGSLSGLATNTVNTPYAWLPMLWELYDGLYAATETEAWLTRANRVKADYAAINPYDGSANSELLPVLRTIANGTPGSTIGEKYSGLQNLYGLLDVNLTQLVAAAQNLNKAQLAYGASTTQYGPFAHYLNGTTWDFGGFDALSNSGWYQAQVGLWAAKALYEANTKFEDLRGVVMDWFTWVDSTWATQEPDFPPIRFNEDVKAFPGQDPGVQALIGEAALWANLAGEDPGITFRLILRSLKYLKSQFITDPSNLMFGSWSDDQQLYIGGPLRDYESRFHSSSIRFLSELLIQKENLIYPPCSEALEIPFGEPVDQACCGSPDIGCGLFITYSLDEPGYISTNPTPTRLCRMESHFEIFGYGDLRWYIAESNKMWIEFDSDEILEV